MIHRRDPPPVLRCFSAHVNPATLQSLVLQLLYNWDGVVEGVATNDFGIAKSGQPKSNFAPGVDLRARVTLLAEGCRGSLSEVGAGESAKEMEHAGMVMCK